MDMVLIVLQSLYTWSKNDMSSGCGSVLEQLIPIPEVRGLNPVIVKNLFMLNICKLSTVYWKDDKKKRLRMAHLKKKDFMRWRDIKLFFSGGIWRLDGLFRVWQINGSRCLKRHSQKSQLQRGWPMHSVQGPILKNCFVVADRAEDLYLDARMRRYLTKSL